MNGLERFRLVVGCIIVVAWAASLVFDFVPDKYAISVNGSMMLVAGYLFGPVITGRQHRKEDER